MYGILWTQRVPWRDDGVRHHCHVIVRMTDNHTGPFSKANRSILGNSFPIPRIFSISHNRKRKIATSALCWYSGVCFRKLLSRDPPLLLCCCSFKARAVARGPPRACSRMARAVRTVRTAPAGSAWPCPSARCPPPPPEWGGSSRRDVRCRCPEWWWFSRPQVTPRTRMMPMPCPVRTARRTTYESRLPQQRAPPCSSRSSPLWTSRSRR